MSPPKKPGTDHGKAAMAVVRRWLARTGVCWLAPLPLLLAIVIAYAPGLHGPFVLDDGENISQNKAVAMTQLSWDALSDAVLGNDSGPLKRPLPSLSFALNHFFAGGFDNTFPYKVTNLVIHLVNAVLVYCLTLLLGQTPALAAKLTKPRRLAFAATTAGIWALHPIQLTSVLYVVQRMNSLSAVFVLAGLILFVLGRMQLQKDARSGFTLMYVGVIGGGVLGCTSKENALLIPLYAAAVDYALFGFKTARRNLRPSLITFYVLVLALPLLASVAYLAWNPATVTATYATRHFSMLERLFTETRVLWLYVGLIVFPVSSRFSLFHDDIALSTSIWTPLTTPLAILGILFAVVFALVQRKRYPVVSLAVLWFVCGHLLESTVFGLELVYEHRNYLPSFGILVALCFGLLHLISSRKPAYTLLPLAFGLFVGFATWARAGLWSDIVTLSEYTAYTHPASPRANSFAARVSLNERRDLGAAIRYTLRGIRTAPEELGFHIDLQVLLTVLAKEIEGELQPALHVSKNQVRLRVPGIDEELELLSAGKGTRLSHPIYTPDRITELIDARPLSVHAIVAFESLRACLLNEPRTCAVITTDATGWFVKAADSGRTSPTYRAVLAGDTALLYADRGDYAAAAEYMRRAARLLPDFAIYQLATAEYLIRLGRLPEARSFLELLHRNTRSADRASPADLRRVEKLYEAAEKSSAIATPTRKR